MRYYDGGVIVGKVELLKDLPTFFVWLDTELAVMERLIAREEQGSEAMGYLVARQRTLQEVAMQLRGVRDNG